MPRTYEQWQSDGRCPNCGAALVVDAYRRTYKPKQAHIVTPIVAVKAYCNECHIGFEDDPD